MKNPISLSKAVPLFTQPLSITIHNSTSKFIRFTPHGAVDYSPAISLSANFIAVASYGSRSWGGDSSIYFHRQADDGWWSVFQVTLPENFEDSELPKAAPVRVTPPGVHCFTPAAFQDGKRIAVATRRKGNSYRHVEIFDVESDVLSCHCVGEPEFASL
ncbi:hypothetical protein H0E87_005200 [Populus deltoides]|uniref:Uncharacterized protein n=1 Tax=Populus deltoides TaxID=3696 RepID=A0A8T2ZIJ5_POPDE|nr:hypothetical protein H0E87_005200 [Populus deltoides]